MARFRTGVRRREARGGVEGGVKAGGGGGGGGEAAGEPGEAGEAGEAGEGGEAGGEAAGGEGGAGSAVRPFGGGGGGGGGWGGTAGGPTTARGKRGRATPNEEGLPAGEPPSREDAGELDSVAAGAAPGRPRSPTQHTPGLSSTRRTEINVAHVQRFPLKSGCELQKSRPDRKGAVCMS